MTITEVFVTIVVVTVSGWTLAMARTGVEGATVSATMRRWAGRGGFTPLALAGLFGHFFGWRSPSWVPTWSPAVLAALGVVSLAVTVADRRDPHPLWVWWLAAPVAALLGAALWPLYRL